MSGVEIEGDSITAPASPDPEKMPVHVTSGKIGDQIPHVLLEELAPNGEEEYILDKINNMTEEEAISIIQESRKSGPATCSLVVETLTLPKVKFHADDWNFPSEMRDRMRRLIEDPKLYGEFYDRDLRIDATMMRYSSPYPGVRAVVDIQDDTKVPIETIRAYFLGIGWAVIGTFMSTFFNSRFPGISKMTLISIVLSYVLTQF